MTQPDKLAELIALPKFLKVARHLAHCRICWVGSIGTPPDDRPELCTCGLTNLRNALPDLIAEIERLKIHADINEQCARSYEHKQPFCGHENRYTFTDDGGKTGKCVMCENERLTKERDEWERLRIRADESRVFHFEQAEKARAERDELRRDREWRDIVTAPRDGTIILYAGRNEAHEWVTAGRWTEEGWYEINLDSSDVHGREDYPERWMPMPTPPDAALRSHAQPGAKT